LAQRVLFVWSMVIEKSGFLLMAGTLAAGGVGGWLVHDSKTQREHAAQPPAQVAPNAPPTPSASVLVIEHAPPPPVCDDNVGTPEDCPAMGPADEGVCSNFAAKRCAEFKLAFKPKVAAAAVSCLRHLKPNELCDPARVNLCGHTALMAACPDLPPPPPTPGGTNLNNAPPPPPSAASIACENIVKSCAGASIPDCRQTLSGMTDVGRASMTDCLATHCNDKGLLGCEGVKKP
jgi:hypothetical protein